MESTFVTEGNTEILSDEFSDEEENSNADYLVIEEHIETKELDAKIATRELKEEPLPEEFSPVITCGTLIIRKEGTEMARKRSKSRSASRDSAVFNNRRSSSRDSKASNFRSASRDSKITYKPADHISRVIQHDARKHEKEKDVLSRSTDQKAVSKDEMQHIRDSYQLLQEMFDNKMRTVSPEVREKSKSLSPYPAAKRPANDKNLIKDSQCSDVNECDVTNAENIFDTGVIDELFPDFSVSVLKFQDAIESFSEAIFKDALEESYNDKLSKVEVKNHGHDHAGAIVHRKFHELGEPIHHKIDHRGQEAFEEPIEEPIVEEFVSKLEANHNDIENVLVNSEPNAATPEELIQNFESSLVLMEQDSPCLSERIPPLETLCFQQRVAVVEDLFEPESVEQIGHQSPLVPNEPDLSLSLQVEHRLESLASKILEDSKSEAVSNNRLPQSQSFGIPEICITNDSTDCSSPLPQTNNISSEPTWVSIPIIRGNSMPEHTSNQVSIQEMSDSESYNDSNQHSPLITEEGDIKINRKISEPMKSGVQIEEVVDKNMSARKMSEVHIAFNRHVDDMQEEAGVFVPVVCEEEVGQVTNAIHNYKKAQISIEETLKYDEQLKDVCEYDTDQIQLQNSKRSYPENNAKEFENSAVLLNSNNLSEKNLDINSTRSETNIDTVYMSRSENFANIHEQKEIYSENEKSKNALNNTKLSDKKNNELVVSYGTQTSKQIDEQPAVGWMKAFAMVITGAILLTYYWIPSGGSSSGCSATRDDQGHQTSGCSTDGYIGLSHLNYEEL